MSAELDVARQWLAKARNDLLDADNNLAAARAPCDMVCFHCQQAAEKALKAFLAAKGVPPPRTHDLLLLLEMIVPLAPDAEGLRECLVILTPYSVATRYPDDNGLDTPDLADAKEARQNTEQVLEWLAKQLPDVVVER